MTRFLLTLLLVAVTALLWLAYGFASSNRLFGASALTLIIQIAASVSSAALLVLVAGQLVFRFGFERLLQTEPTQLQRGLVIAVLSFVAAAIFLAYLGLDLSTILTTSALVTAIVGLSIQPMLGSLMSGLSVDRVVRIGDGVLLNGEPVEITSLNWRSVTGRRPDGSSVVVPNARLADTTLEVFARDRPRRGEVVVEVPTTVAPHRLRKLIMDIISDFDEVDSTQPVVALPLKHEPNKPVTSYRIGFWVRDYVDRAAVEGRVLRRIWYAFPREGILASPDAPTPLGELQQADLVSATTAALRAAAAAGAEGVGAAPDTAAKSAIEAGETLLYDDGERIVLPERCAGSLCLLVEGELSEVASSRQVAASGYVRRKTPARLAHELTRAASLELIERALALRIGPYAGYAVEQASANGASLAAVCAALAEEIDDPQEQQRFLRETRPPEKMYEPGLLFRCRRDPAQRLVSDPTLRAVDHALILAAPESAFRADGTGSSRSGALPGKKRGKPNDAAAA